MIELADNNIIVQPTTKHLTPTKTNLDTFIISCDTDMDYALGLSTIWTSTAQNLLIIEEDMQPTIGQIQRILACDFPLCTGMYFSSPSHTGLDHDIVPHRDETGFLDPNGNSNFCLTAGLGFAKIGKYWRTITHVPLVHWKKLDIELSKEVLKYGKRPWHLHRDMWIKHEQS